ncbi:hypothetical protein DFH08DRAFT_826567 [Mycena albidolilacea]|uniref:Uncharacterized protein n=1 Tax=Mycena albidolilacea TaxID=1033008 RepID=A0AAD6Z066_9AGAR|nr:hypothetical protein DFH08DRAFT_826567 [Mycena albidolilacea]
MFKSSLIFIFALAAMVTAQNGHPVATLSSPLQTGLNCHIGGIDCAFGGQVHACCSVNPITHSAGEDKAEEQVTKPGSESSMAEQDSLSDVTRAIASDDKRPQADSRMRRCTD